MVSVPGPTLGLLNVRVNACLCLSVSTVAIVQSATNDFYCQIISPNKVKNAVFLIHCNQDEYRINNVT